MTYPEHEKLRAIQGESQAIGDFLMQMSAKGFILAYYPEESDHLYPFPRSTENLLAEYFNINLDILEKEKLQILNKIREANEKGLERLKED